MAWLGNVGILCWIVAALLAATIQLVGAGAWGLAPGHYYAKFSGIFYRADEVFNRAGIRQPLGLNKDRFSTEQLFVYLEYGVAERLTVIGRTKIGREVVQNSLLKRTTTGIGDVEVAGQYQWLNKPLATAVWIGLKLPTGYDPQFEPPLGTGDPDMEAKLLAGRAFSPWAFYLGAEAGYRWRGGRFSNQIDYLWDIGVTPRDRLSMKFFLAGRQTLSDAVENSGLIGGSVQISEGDLFKWGGHIGLRIFDAVWLEFGGERIIRGQNIGAGTGWNLGLVYIHYIWSVRYTL